MTLLTYVLDDINGSKRSMTKTISAYRKVATKVHCTLIVDQLTDKT